MFYGFDDGCAVRDDPMTRCLALAPTTFTTALGPVCTLY